LYSKHLESRGAGLHHIGVYVEDLAEASRSFAERGYQCILSGRIRELGEFAYFETADLHCIVELLQLSLSFPVFLAKNAECYSGRQPGTPTRAPD
jgi:hypothetical protein